MSMSHENQIIGFHMANIHILSNILDKIKFFTIF